MSLDLNRRDLLLAGAAAWLGAGTLAGATAPQPKGATKKLLFYTKSTTFQHPVIAREGDKPSHAGKILADIGKEHGFEVVETKDGKVFEPDQIGQWDVFVFESQGNPTTLGLDKQPPISADGEKAFYDAIRGGKGFVGMHCAADTFGHFAPRNKGADDPYIQMIGGEFIVHGKQQESKIEIADPEFPGITTGFGKEGKSFKITDEWYALKHMPDDLHVILYQNTEGMEGRMYQRPNFPMTWARRYGQGRVFYTSMGHREDVWSNPMYQALLLGALAWSSGRAEANIEPNFQRVTPMGNQLPT
jgi:type 1 glutamine amidotransferase